MPGRFPDVVAYIFEGFDIHGEDVELDPEDPTPAAEGQVKVRVLDGFLFEKGGRFVYPRADLPSSWWDGVTAFGYTAATTGDYRYFIWAGHWDQDYPGKHIEVVILGGLKGIMKESNVHWRNGKEDILWLDTELGYSYALMEPAEEYDRGSWARVTASWMNVPDEGRPSDPKFIKVNRQAPRPGWWDRAGDEAWEMLHSGKRPGSLPTGIASSLEDSKASEGSSAGKATPESITAASGSSDEEPEIIFIGYKAAPAATRKAPTAAKPHNRGAGKAKASARRTVGERTAAQRTITIPSDKEEAVGSKVVPKAKREACKPRTKATVKTPPGPPNLPSRKRRVISGPSDFRQRQKQKTFEVINVDSGSSDQEDTVTSSPPPAPSSPIDMEDSRRPPVTEQAEPAGQGEQNDGEPEGSSSAIDPSTSRAEWDRMILAQVRRLYPNAQF
ncbi:hypothetical protein FRC11_014264 [Ceratobasidium sp. 423]|nr:hypothetical protein FRC11_014264 [Ceratobasidium sp. 423]